MCIVVSTQKYVSTDVNYFFFFLAGSGEDLKLLQQANVIVADNNLVGMQLYNLPVAKWVQGTWAGVDKLLQHYDSNKVVKLI